MIVFLDSCALIYWLEGDEPWRSKVVASLRDLRRQAGADTGFAISRLAVLECLIQPLRDDDRRIETVYRQFFASDDLQIVELTPPVVEQAAHLRAEYRLQTPDALQAASALSLPGDVRFLTNDSHFERVPGLDVVLIE